MFQYTDSIGQVQPEEIVKTERVVLPKKKAKPKTPEDVLKWLPANATPAQQDSMVQAHFKPDSIHWSQRPDTLHLPGHPKPQKIEDIIYIKPAENLFFKTEKNIQTTSKLKNYGTEGILKSPDILRTDSTISILIVILLLFICTLVKTKKLLITQTKNFFRRNPTNAYRVNKQDNSSVAVQTMIIILFALLVTLACHVCVIAPGMYGNITRETAFLLGGIILSVMIYVCMKLALYGLTGWVFFTPVQNQRWKNSYYYILLLAGVALIPLILIRSHTPVPMETAIKEGLCILLGAKILLLYKQINIFFSRIDRILQIILYFCALEIVPPIFWGSILLVI